MAACVPHDTWSLDRIELQPLSEALRDPGTPAAVEAARGGRPAGRRGRWAALALLAFAACACGLLAAASWRHSESRARYAGSLQQVAAGAVGDATILARAATSLDSSIFDSFAQEIWEKVEAEAKDDNRSDNVEEPPGKTAEGDKEWEVVFHGVVRVRNSTNVSSNDNIIATVGPQGAVVVGEPTKDGWLKLLHRPGYIKIEASDDEVLIKPREVTYMIIPHGICSQFGGPQHYHHANDSQGMRNISNNYSCMAAGESLGSKKAAVLTPDLVCTVKDNVSGGKNRTICSSGMYPSYEDDPAEAVIVPDPTPAPPATIPGSTTTTGDEESTNASATTTTEEVECDGCCPTEHDRPTVVIPAYERDICKLKVTARSIAEHDKDKLLGKVIICWVSHHSQYEYSGELDEIKAILSGHGEVEILEMVIGDGEQGWVAQQAAKLKVASRVPSQYYVVLDAKNTLLQDVKPNTFLTACNVGKIFGRYKMEDGSMPGMHLDWYRHSAEVLGQPLMDYGTWPASITPIIMHKQTVMDMLGQLGESPDFGQCSGGLCSAFERGATEFTLYLVYVGRVGKMECIHEIEDRPWGNELAASIWRTDDEAGKQATAGQIKAIAEQSEMNGRVMFFGAQAGALDNFGGDERYNVLQDLFKLYDNAGLYQFGNWDELASCVVGGSYGRL